MQRIQQKYSALILAAGCGSRLNDLTKDYPKCLVKVNGREILDYQLLGYINGGIREENIYIVVGYRYEMICAFLQHKYPKVNVIYNLKYTTTNNMFSLYLGLKELMQNTLTDSIFINNADCIYEESLMRDFIQQEYKDAIAVKSNIFLEESMKVICREDGSLLNISKTIKKRESAGVSLDLYKYSAKTITILFSIIKDFIEVKRDLKQWSEVAFPILFSRVAVYPFETEEQKWIEIDNYEDLMEADRLFCSFCIEDKKVLFVDMDGTICVGDVPITPSIEFIKNCKAKVYFLTNNTSKIPYEYKRKLSKFGINATIEDILTPLVPLIEYLKAKILEGQFRSVYLVANFKVLNYIKQQLPDIEIEFNKEKNQAVILTYDDSIDYQKFKNISILLNNDNVKYFATHSDIFCPSEFGAIPDIGSFIELIYVVTKRNPDKIFGKPSDILVKRIIGQYQINEIAVIGDRLYTDKQLADRIGVDFVCVLSGETKRSDLQECSGTYPSIIVENLASLNFI